MSVPVISIVGFSGSGKTTLIEQLIPIFCALNYRVATIKNAHHKVSLDTPGKDSWRYKTAGASMSMLVTETGLQIIADPVTDRNPELLAQRFLGEVDLVLAEGFSSSAGQKIEVLRRAHNMSLRCQPADGLIALVTDVDELLPNLPHFSLCDYQAIVEFIIQVSGAKSACH